MQAQCSCSGATRILRRGLAVAIAMWGVMAAAGASAAEVKVELSGAQEVPPVQTNATARGAFVVGDDRSVSGSVTVVGIAPTAAHIHQGAPGTNGGVVIPLVKNGDVFSVPAGAKLTEPQFSAFRAGNLYVNVHSTAYPEGEVRAQLRP